MHLWKLIQKYFGEKYFDSVLENEYGIMNDMVGGLNIVTWSELNEAKWKKKLEELEDRDKTKLKKLRYELKVSEEKLVTQKN